jgi:hypothetical protein
MTIGGLRYGEEADDKKLRSLSCGIKTLHNGKMIRQSAELIRAGWTA